VSVPVTADERVLITAEGYEQRCRELDRLRNDERQRLSDLLRDARGDGVLDDNPVLVDLLDDHAQLERRIATLEARLAAADMATGEVFEYQLVGPIEGDPTNGRVSISAPVGRALIGQRSGALVEVATPRGRVTLDVLEVAASAPARKAA
jgi:transcription elongation factor GreA